MTDWIKLLDLPQGDFAVLERGWTNDSRPLWWIDAHYQQGVVEMAWTGRTRDAAMREKAWFESDGMPVFVFGPQG